MYIEIARAPSCSAPMSEFTACVKCELMCNLYDFYFDRLSLNFSFGRPRKFSLQDFDVEGAKLRNVDF